MIHYSVRVEYEYYQKAINNNNNINNNKTITQPVS